MSTVTRQPGDVETALDIEPKRAALWQADHGLHDGAILGSWNSPQPPGPARHNVIEEPEEKAAPLWIADHGQTKQP